MRRLAEFLKNEPIGEDLFSGRAQEHVAETICDNIERLHVIGLEGEWGSGKSNLVKILQQKLSNKDKKYFFFIYDAWAHQMDFQRRAIIEEIVEFIDREDGLLVTKDKLNYVKIKALGTVVETETELQSSFTWASFFLVCSIILTPAAIQLSTTLKFEWINYVISLMPIGCILFAVFISMRKQRKDFFSMGHLEHIKNQLIGAYKQGNTKSTKREYTDTKRPSTVVFRQFFHDVDESIPEKHVLIIVLDNLDRLPRANVQEVWTIIQSCFSDGVVEFPKIKIVIPFDRTHLCVNDEQDSAGNNIHDYTDKTFDAVFRVALPVLNDWEEYFDRQWEKAFGQDEVNGDRQELDYVKRIYDCYTETITPRKIHAFINQCLILSLLHKGHGIKYRYYAVFISHKEHILKNIIEALSDLAYLKGLKRVFEQDEEFFQTIPALSHQVTLERGQEIAIHRVLRLALENGDADKVKEISKIRTFPSILETLLREFNTVDSLQMPICALDGLSPEDYGGEEIYANRWNMIFQGVLDIDLELDTSKDGYLFQYQKVLIKHGSKEQIEAILAKLIPQFNQLEGINAARYIDCIKEVEEIVAPKDIQVLDLLGEIVVPWEQLEKIITDSKGTPSQYRLRSKEEEVDKFLTDLTVEQLAKVSYIGELHKSGYKLEQFKERAKEGAEQTNSYNEFCTLWRNYREVISDKIEINLDIEYLDQYIREAKEHQHSDIESDLLCYIFSKFDFNTVENYSEITSYLSQEDKAEEISDKISLYMSYSDLMFRSTQYKTSSLYCAICKIVTGDIERPLRANPKELLLQFEMVIVCSKVSKEDLSAQLSRWKFVKISDNEVEKYLPVDFLSLIDEVEDDFSENCRTRVKDYLDTRSEEQWAHYIEQGINSYGISAGRIIAYDWPDLVWTKIKDYLQGLVNDRSLPEDIDTWKKYIEEFLKKRKQIGRILGVFYDSLKTEAISVEEFKFWGEWLFKYNKVELDDKTMRRLIPPELLDDEECVKILLHNFTKVVKIYRQASADEHEDFDDKIQKLSGVDENIKELANRIGGFDVNSASRQDHKEN